MSSSNEGMKTAVATVKKEPDNFPAMLKASIGEIAKALPQHMNPDRMYRIALTAFRQNPMLAQCTPRSVLAAVMQSSQLGLEVGLLGEAYLVPFSNNKKVNGQWVKSYECQLIPGYTGLIKLARNSGLVKDVYAHEVREKDEFVLALGLDRDLQHKPLMTHGFPAGEAERGPVTGFYAVAEYKDGSKTFIAISRADVDRIRDGSSGWKSAVESAKKYDKENTSPWAQHYVAMGCKTAVRALSKWMPRSPELAEAIALDALHEKGQSQQLDDKSIIEGTWTAPAVEEQEEQPEPAATAGKGESQDQVPAPTGDEPHAEQKQEAPAGRRRTAAPTEGATQMKMD